MKYNKIAVVVSLGLCSLGSQAIAGSNLADARSVGMGGTGVASADFLTSSFHNPALGAIYREEDDFGLLLPGVGVQLNDSDDMVTTIDDADDTYDKYRDVFENSVADTYGASAELSALLDSLDNKKPVSLTAGAGAALAIPTSFASFNLFAAGYADAFAVANINDKTAGYDATNPDDVKNRFDGSEITVAGMIVQEIGVAISRKFEIGGQSVAFGISPKAQKFESYITSSTIEDFDLDEFEDNKLTTDTMNLDIGAVWTSDHWRAGLTVKDIIAKDVETTLPGFVYEVKPKATIGGAFYSEYFVASLDADLTKETRFTQLNDNTQFVRAGIEGNLFGWLQARAGYSHDLEDNAEDSVTAGIGISPFDVVSLDLSGTYASDSSYGGAANLAFTF